MRVWSGFGCKYARACLKTMSSRVSIRHFYTSLKAIYYTDTDIYARLFPMSKPAS